MKKKLFSILCSFCMLLTCTAALTACKKDNDPPATPPPTPAPEKVISSAFYLGETKIADNTISYNYGDNVIEDLETVSLVASVDETSQTFNLLESEYALSYNNFESTAVLEEIPEEWDAGTYTFALNVTVAEESIDSSLTVAVNKIASENVFDLRINYEEADVTIEYDNSSNIGNDPVFAIYCDGEFVDDADYQIYYISATNFEAYEALETAAEKYSYLDANKVAYNGTYQMVPAEYYMFAAVSNGINYKDTFTAPVNLTITKAQQDYSMVNIQMDYTFNSATCTGEYVTLAQIVEEIGMPTIEEFEGTVEWADDYSALQIAYSEQDPTIRLQVNIIPSNPYIEYSPTTIDVTITLHQGLIQIPTLIDAKLVFAYTGSELGITAENGSQYFSNWFSAEDAAVLDANFDTHTDIGTYTFVASLANNPNFAFTEDGETVSETQEITINWSIEKEDHRCYVLGLSGIIPYAMNTCTIEATETLPDDGSIDLPTFAQFHNYTYIDQPLEYEIVTTEDSTGEATIVDGDMIVTTKGVIVLKVTNPGSTSVKPIELTIVYTII